MQLTVIPRGPSSRASDFAQPVTPGRTAFESARFSVGSFTALDVSTRIRPPSLCSRCGRQSCTSRTAGTNSSSTACSRFSAVTAVAGPGGGPPPFQTRMSMPPKAWSVRSTTSWRWRGFVTSPRTARAPILSASRSRRSRRRANIVTLAPSPASDSAVASPRPEEAPETIAVRPLRPRSIDLGGEHADDVPDGLGGTGQQLLLVFRQLQLDDLLDPARAELDGDAHVEALDAVFALEVGRAGEDALLVEHHRVNHLRRGGARRVPRGGSEQRDHLAAPRCGPVDELGDPFFVDELRQRNTADRRRRDDRDHLIAVAPEHEPLNVLDRRPGLPGDEGPEPGRVEDPSLTEHPLPRESGDVLGDVAHRVERIRVDDDDVRIVAARDLLSHGAADHAGADDGDLPPHTRTASFSIRASATSLVPTAVGSSRRGFMSYVTLLPSWITSEIARSRLSAAFCSSRCRSISIPESSWAIGLTLFWPAYFGAEPCVGSKTATSSPWFAPGARPSPPIIPAQRSERTSP